MDNLIINWYPKFLPVTNTEREKGQSSHTRFFSGRYVHIEISLDFNLNDVQLMA